MGWGRYLLLGNLGQQLDLQDHEEQVRQLRSELGSQSNRDQQQDQQINTLRAENQDLRVYLSMLVRLLITKNVVQESEVEQIVQAVQRTAPKP